MVASLSRGKTLKLVLPLLRTRTATRSGAVRMKLLCRPFLIGPWNSTVVYFEARRKGDQFHSKSGSL
jgi:hypothetical protein